MTALEAVLEVDEEKKKMEAEEDRLTDEMANHDGDDESMQVLLTRLQDVQERLDDLGAETAEARAASILAGLQFSPAMQQKKTKEFSGGWRMRISLARALFLQPMLLILDEPTNHLDMEATVWLEDYLKNWNKILIMISHSQDFMNNVCTSTIHFNNHRKRLDYYGGNYDSYVQTRRETADAQMKVWKREQEEIASMKDYIARFGHGSAKLARQAQSKEKTLAKMVAKGLTEKPTEDKALVFNFPDPGHLAPPVLQVINLNFNYAQDMKKPLMYKDVNFGVDLDTRVALVGPNGVGKTTLLNIIEGKLMPTDGMVKPHSHLRIARYNQHMSEVLPADMSALDYMMEEYADWLDKQDASDKRKLMRQWLGRFGMSGAVQVQPMGHLSDGQKSRIVFSWMAKKNPHILLLDEPTNHLDMETIDSLADAIKNFKGGCVLVSHDMRLISQVAKEIWLCEDQNVTVYRGDIYKFKMKLRKDMNLQASLDASNKDEEGAGAGGDEESKEDSKPAEPVWVPKVIAPTAKPEAAPLPAADEGEDGMDGSAGAAAAGGAAGGAAPAPAAAADDDGPKLVPLSAAAGPGGGLSVLDSAARGAAPAPAAAAAAPAPAPAMNSRAAAMAAAPAPTRGRYVPPHLRNRQQAEAAPEDSW